jgi:chorismate-pyruvate lyase
MLERPKAALLELALALARVRRDPMAPPAAARAVGATALILGAALVGVTIRLLPWALDPAIAWSTLAPFAKSLLAVAFEAALMTGWPVGWALATQRLVERGEARVLASLGEPPVRTIGRLLPQALVLGAVLVFSSMVLGREAAAPGRVVNALLAEGRASCSPGETHGIPFVSATWLCPQQIVKGNEKPRLVGRAPVGNVVFTAEDATVSDDLRRIELAGARLALPAGAAATNVRVRVDTLVLRGLAPWARASSLPPLVRAALVTGSALVAGCSVVAAILRTRRRRVGGVAAAAIGAAGPLAALVTLRALELRVPETSPGWWLLLFGLVPLAALIAVVGAVALVTALPERRGADSK